jgi:hypothetical protein
MPNIPEPSIHLAVMEQSLRAYFLATMRAEELDKLTFEELHNKTNKVFAKSDAKGAGNADKSLIALKQNSTWMRLNGAKTKRSGVVIFG